MESIPLYAVGEHTRYLPAWVYWLQSMYENDAANGRTKAAEGGPGRWERSDELGKKVIRDDQLAIS